ncbi:16S rRNA (cytosine(1402)-N(4))-methyltransferase RsmH [Patescibacteria group bacterium]|nr:MAG: 16S rRNA (cytosine(1402)-N(4))-methyltransferase RsmH [Patescibacteria group bacterium]
MSKEHPPQSKDSDELRSNESLALHVPVLLESTLTLLKPTKGESYLDLTAGYGGHARKFLAVTENYAESVLVDRDDYAIMHLKSFSKQGVQLLHTDFVSAAKQLVQEGRQFNIVLVDLGVSSPQLDQSERGFSFTNSGSLDMRMDRRQGVSAETLVNTASADELTRIITQYGEEPTGYAKQIATAIVGSRPLSTTEELASLIKNTYRGKWKKTHPATRTFQALRIAVNDELRQIEDLLPLLPRLLKPGGRVGIISFHSLEDRLVKRYFKEQFEAGLEAELRPLTKKPILGALNDVHNPRARSSKLRAAVKK